MKNKYEIPIWRKDKIMFVSDFGGEFVSKKLKAYLKEENAFIYHIGSHKACIVERSIRYVFTCPLYPILMV